MSFIFLPDYTPGEKIGGNKPVESKKEEERREDGRKEEKPVVVKPVLQGNPLDRVKKLSNHLQLLFPGREEQVEVVVLGLATGLPVFLMSPPGTAKTMMIDFMTRFIDGAKYFYYLLTRFTEPDELLGPLDIKALREGVYKRRSTGRLPEAEIVFLDEIFKASSAIRNSLLDIILNRRILDADRYIKLPIRALYTASNEPPEDEEDWAFYDRLVLRSFFDYVDPQLLDAVIKQGVEITVVPPEKVASQPLLTINDVDSIQETVRVRAIEITRNDALRKKAISGIEAIRSKGLEYSDRRAVQLFIVLAGLATLRGRREPLLMDLADAFILTTPRTPDEVARVEEILEEARIYTGSEIVREIEQLVKVAREELEKFQSSEKISDLEAFIATYRQLKGLQCKAKRVPKKLREALLTLDAKVNELAEKYKLLGIELRDIGAC